MVQGKHDLGGFQRDGLCAYCCLNLDGVLKGIADSAPVTSWCPSSVSSQFWWGFIKILNCDRVKGSPEFGSTCWSQSTCRVISEQGRVSVCMKSHGFVILLTSSPSRPSMPVDSWRAIDHASAPPSLSKMQSPGSWSPQSAVEQADWSILCGQRWRVSGWG